MQVPEGYQGCENCGVIWVRGGIETHSSDCFENTIARADAFREPSPGQEIPLGIERCEWCGFAWKKGEPEQHAEECPARHSGELNTRFTHHPPNDTQQLIYQALRAHARDLAQRIFGDVPEGREQSLALTKLEECVFWANAGVARRS